MERVEVAGVKGRFVIDDMFREVTLYPAGNLEKTVYSNPLFGGMRDFDDTFRNRLTRFVEQVNEGAKPEEIDGSGAEGLAAQRVLAAAIRSVETVSRRPRRQHRDLRSGSGRGAGGRPSCWSPAFRLPQDTR